MVNVHPKYNVKMARIVIDNLFKKTLEINNQADLRSKSLLRHFQDNQLDWMHACGGKGRCTTCKVIILEGKEYFSPMTASELMYHQAGELQASERLSCQTKITGDVVIAVPDECKLPHIRYSEK